MKVAIVGAGPSGFYAVEALHKVDAEIQVDLFDRLPTPFGLVRGGIAPDHQPVKRVERIYRKIAASPGVRLFGNVKLGADIQVQDLQSRYDAILYATGNEIDRDMGLEGEHLSGIHGAAAFVGWYNGHPDHRDAKFDLNGAHAVIIGVGNVAVDIARLLGRDTEELAPTDIAEHAIRGLRESGVRHITLLGRRGAAQAAYTPKELKELGTLSRSDLIFNPENAQVDELSMAWMQAERHRDAERNLTYMMKKLETEPEGKPCEIHIRFLASPVEFLGEDGQVVGIRVETNTLTAKTPGDNPRPRGTGQFDEIPADIVFKAVGYRGVPIPGVPFHQAWGIIPNVDGRVSVSETDDTHLVGQYAVGWAKRGPSGTVGTNKPCAAHTVEHLLADYAAGQLPKPTGDDIKDLLKRRDVRYVDNDAWLRIDEAEIARGQAKGKIREKFVRIDEMLAALDT